MTNSGVTAGGGQGAEYPPDTLTLLTGTFLITYREKRGKEKRENGEEKKQNRKREGGKLKMEEGKVTKSYKLRRGLFFFSFFLLLFIFKTTEICFGSAKTGIFYWGKVFHAGKKIRKNDFASSEKIPLTPLVANNVLFTNSRERR